MNSVTTSTTARGGRARVVRPGDDSTAERFGGGRGHDDIAFPGGRRAGRRPGSLASPSDVRCPMPEQNDPEIITRLDRLDERIARLCDLLACQRTIRDYYSPEEAAEVLGKAPFTVREWCRLGRIRAIKKASGRGMHAGWAVPHDEILRYQREGLLPDRRA